MFVTKKMSLNLIFNQGYNVVSRIIGILKRTVSKPEKSVAKLIDEARLSMSVGSKMFFT